MRLDTVVVLWCIKNCYSSDMGEMLMAEEDVHCIDYKNYVYYAILCSSDK